MMLIVILLTLLSFVTYVYVRWSRMKQYWARRHVAHIPPHPLLGSMTFLLKESPTIWFRRMYGSLKEPYAGIWIFWRPSLLVNSTKIARNILVKDQANFRNRFASSGTTDPIGRLNLFTLDDPLWTAIRKRLTVLFTPFKLKGVQKVITVKANELVDRIERERQKSKSIDIRNVMTDYSTDIIGISAFGVASDATRTGTSHIKSITEKLMTFDLFRGISFCCGFFIPELVDLFRFKLFPEDSTNYMRKVLREIIQQRGGLEKKISEPMDLLDILIKIKQEGGEELDMTENMMIAQAAVFLQGGFDTTATSLSFVIYELAFNPEVQMKLNKELQEAKIKYDDDLLHSGVLCQLEYLNCAINETFRKYPIIGWLDRVALADYKVDDHITIKAGTPVYVNVVGIHYDPEFYPEPEMFNPDRFLSENKVNTERFAFLPFGEGPRKCIGQQLGISAIRHGLAAIMLNYDVRPLPNSPKPNEVLLEKNGLHTVPGEILSVEFIPK